MGNSINELQEFGMKAEKLGQATKVMEALGKMGETAMSSTAIDVKTKELIAVAIGITVKCVPCLLHHVKAAVDVGITREELVGMIEICVLMGGGPSSAYGAIALDIYDDYTK